MNIRKKIKKVLLDELISNYDNGNIDDGGIGGGEEAIEKIVKLFSIHFVSQQRELLIAYNMDFYKGMHDVKLKDIEFSVDKYLSNL